MEYPDKEENPKEYVIAILEELKNTNISKDEKGLAYQLGKNAYDLTERIEGCDLGFSHMYVVDALEMVCKLIKNNHHKDQLPIIHEILEDSEQVFGLAMWMEAVLTRIIENTGNLEVKVLSDEIVNNMKNQK